MHLYWVVTFTSTSFSPESSSFQEISAPFIPPKGEHVGLVLFLEKQRIHMANKDRRNQMRGRQADLQPTDPQVNVQTMTREIKLKKISWTDRQI